MTYITHISAVRAVLNSGLASDDAKYSDRVISHFLETARSVLTERKLDKYVLVSPQSFQTLCVDLELGTHHDCCDAPQLECKVLKSTIKLPKLLNGRWGNFIMVTDLAGNTISELSNTANKYSQYAVAKAKNSTGWFIRDNYLFILNSTKLVKVLFIGIFSSPTEVASINCAASNESSDCLDFGQVDFPIDSDLVAPMYELAIQLLKLSQNIPNDLENDTKSPETVLHKE